RWRRSGRTGPQAYAPPASPGPPTPWGGRRGARSEPGREGASANPKPRAQGWPPLPVGRSPRLAKRAPAGGGDHEPSHGADGVADDAVPLGDYETPARLN